MCLVEVSADRPASVADVTSLDLSWNRLAPGGCALVLHALAGTQVTVLRLAGEQGKSTVFLFADTQIKEEAYLEDINGLLNAGEVPNLFPNDEKVAICEAVRAACKRNKIRDGYIRLVVTRGAGTLGLDPNRCSNPQVIIIADKIQLYPETFYKKGLEIVTVPTTRNHTNAVNPAIKSLNYLNNILAKIEAINAGCVEAIMLNSQGFVAECTGDNVFMLKGGELLTPPLAAGALYGITRSVAIELAESLGIKAKEPNLTRYDLYNADEVFITGTAAEVVPVVKIDGRQIGSGKPGKLTKKLIKAYQDLTNSTGEVI